MIKPCINLDKICHMHEEKEQKFLHVHYTASIFVSLLYCVRCREFQKEDKV